MEGTARPRARAFAGRWRNRARLTLGAASARRFVTSASFWTPEHLLTSAWVGHAPFAFWLCGTSRPTSIVELGTQSGFSYLVLCQAIRDHGLNATSCAVDTWEGDDHAGFYGAEVLDELRRRHSPFAGFSTLLRSSFTDAASRFEDGSIDLLHIDGLHTYDAVRADYENWRPKVSERGIILFHDTTSFAPGFGVHRFWAEISGAYPSFEFLHSGGLGMLVVGDRAPRRVQELAAAAGRPRACAAIRHRYESLGKRIAAIES